ncbi:hypothetical protein ZWY2020_056906 [Hordeum vulgare]|nr:hypothetical protein ZWY2020_056906 [Hordeum vulgare]
MATSLEQFEHHLTLQRHNIIEIDLEYTNEPDKRQKPTLVQLSIGKTQLVLLFQLTTAERCIIFDNFLADPKYTFAGFSIDDNKTGLERVNLEVTNFIDIQKEWRVPEDTKELDSLANIVGMLVDDYYNGMKKKITHEEHMRCCSLPLSKGTSKLQKLSSIMRFTAPRSGRLNLETVHKNGYEEIQVDYHIDSDDCFNIAACWKEFVSLNGFETGEVVIMMFYREEQTKGKELVPLKFMIFALNNV